MLLNAKNENIRFNGHDCDYISFDTAERSYTGAELYMYEGYSHGVYEQAKDFNSRVLEFLIRQK